MAPGARSIARKSKINMSHLCTDLWCMHHDDSPRWWMQLVKAWKNGQNYKKRINSLQCLILSDLNWLHTAKLAKAQGDELFTVATLRRRSDQSRLCWGSVPSLNPHGKQWTCKHFMHKHTGRKKHLQGAFLCGKNAANAALRHLSKRTHVRYKMMKTYITSFIFPSSFTKTLVAEPRGKA